MTDQFAPSFLVERPQEQRFWVVRASGGHYVRHFRQAELMAIGHLDGLGLQPGAVENSAAPGFELALKRVNAEHSKASLTSHARQAEAFCASIQANDLVVTLDADWLMVGCVVAGPYIDREAVVIADGQGTEDKMQHQLRRKVSWGPLLRRNSVPLAMEMTLFAHQTVFNIDRYWTSVYHLLYPCFTYEGRLYLSANIQQQSELDNYSISQLFGLLSGVEVMAKLFVAQSDEWESYPANLSRLREELDLSLTSKAEFMSPGTIWSSLLVDGSTITWVSVIYVMLFGGDLKFFKADGLVDTHTRQKIWELVLKLFESHDVKKLRRSLKVDVPRIDTSALEVPAQKAKRQRKSLVVAIDPPTASPSDQAPK